MAILHKHTSFASPISILTPNSLANNGRTNQSTAVDNDLTANQQLYFDVEGVFAWGSAPTDGSVMRLYYFPSIDGGTTYPIGDSSNPPSLSQLVATFVLTAQTAQRIVIPNLLMPAGKTKFLLENLSGQALSGSGNTVRIALHAQQTTS